MMLQIRLVLMCVFGPQNIVVAVIVSARMGYLALNTVGSSQNLIRKLTRLAKNTMIPKFGARHLYDHCLSSFWGFGFPLNLRKRNKSQLLVLVSLFICTGAYRTRSLFLTLQKFNIQLLVSIRSQLHYNGHIFIQAFIVSISYICRQISLFLHGPRVACSLS